MTAPVVDGTADELVLEILLDPAGRADPYPRYERLREIAPVLQSSIGLLVLTRYADCQAVLGDARLGRGLALRQAADGGAPLAALDSDPTVRDQFFAHAGHNMLFADPPDHTRLRRPARPSPRRGCGRCDRRCSGWSMTCWTRRSPGSTSS
jgi:cytochrome P450